jgi:hypothetical protein
MPAHSRLKDGALWHAYVAGIHVFCRLDKQDVDGRDEPGHDGCEDCARNKCGHDNGEDLGRDKPGHDGGYAAYFFSEVLLLRGSSAGLT